MEFWTQPVGMNLGEKLQLKKLKHTKYNLSREQKKLLQKQGHKYYQLMDGTIAPLSAKQKHFVDMCKGLVEPNDEWERIWKSYVSTLEEERRLESIHRENLRHSPERREYLDHLWLAGAPHTDGPAQSSAAANDHSRECRRCRGSGMKADGASCDACNGRGSIT